MRGLLLAALLAVGGASGSSGRGVVEGRVEVRRDGAAADASGVVVYLIGFEEPPPDTIATIRQRGKRFLPELLPITVGQSVTFPNDDSFFHNVFSPSAAHRFDLGQFPRGETKTKRFPNVGVVDVFCNIHPQMAATILVLPNRRWSRAAADGRFRIDDVPPGRWTAYGYSRRAGEPVSAPVDVSAGEVTTLALTLDETRADFAHPNKYGEKYRDPETYR